MPQETRAGDDGEGVGLLGFLGREGPLSAEQARLLNPLQLAFVGDTVFDLYVRSHLLWREPGQLRQLHRTAVSFVNCQAQAKALERIEQGLTSEERDVCRRGRNAHSRPPRNASPADYARATGLEALVGYLYLSGQEQRLQCLMEQIVLAHEEEAH